MTRTTALPPIRILHVHGGSAPTTRSRQLIDALGQGCAHDIAPADYPELSGRLTPGRLQRLARDMLGHDLVLTYGYGAMAAVMAHTVFGGSLPLPPLVHHEDEAGALNWSRNWYRRVALGRAAALVVPSARLEAIAVDIWHQPRGRVKCIVPGIRTAAFAAKPRRDALPRVIKRAGELWLGTVASGASELGVVRLVKAFAMLPERWQLVIVGEVAAKDAIRNAALRLDLGHRVHLPGSVADRAPVLGLFDLFALALDSEQAPMASIEALIEAMAAGLAVVAGDVGDVAATLAPENRPFVVAPGDDRAFAAALCSLGDEPALRTSVGAANRVLARAKHDQAAMVLAYRTVYGAALGRDRFP